MQGASSTSDESGDAEAGCCGSCCDAGAVEYEDVLFGCEKAVLDRVEAASQSTHCFGPRREDGKFQDWEGIDPNFPEHHQRWQGIRERNVIFSLVFWMLRRGRKEPTGCERINLLLLYMAVWFMCFSYLERRKRDAVSCEQSWIHACVPESLGGGCHNASLCAELVTLDATPKKLKDYAAVMGKRSSEFAREQSMECLGDDVGLVCRMPMCSAANTPCDGGLCDCRAVENPVLQYMREIFLFTIFFKVLYFPFDLLLRFELKGVWHVLGVGASFAVGVLLLLGGAVTLWLYEPDGRSFGLSATRFALTFISLCSFEMIKSFTLGYLVGTYVIQRNCCPTAARIWKYLLA